jgi:hypothetical protein
LIIGASVGCSSADTRPAHQVPVTSGDAGPNSPIDGLEPQTWTWVPFDDAYCRDGSTTGIGVNANPASDKVMIFLEGGGACFNAITCAMNSDSFGVADFAYAFDGTEQNPNPGIFNRNDPNNPVRDWNFVYVPYCTGDVHAGANPDGSIAPLGSQKFVGYTNIDHYLKRIVPTFANATQVLLTGISAGGFGATGNYVQVANAFGSVPVYLIDDSGPYMDSPYVAPCLAQSFAQTWNLQATLLRDCGDDCSDPSHYFIDYQKHLARTYPSVPMGLIESTGDSTIAYFFGFGANDCALAEPLSESTFAAGVQDIRTQMSGYPNFGSFVFLSKDHTTLENAVTFDTRAAGDTKLTTWLTALLAGQVTTVGP